MGHKGYRNRIHFCSISDKLQHSTGKDNTTFLDLVMYWWVLLLLLACCQHTKAQCECSEIDCFPLTEGFELSEYSFYYLYSTYLSPGNSFEGCTCKRDNFSYSTDTCDWCDIYDEDSCVNPICFDISETEVCLHKCVSPTGNCDWYSDCLQPTYPKCTGKSSYPVGYGQYYCERFKANLNTFSEEGKEWVAGVQVCLQLFLHSKLDAFDTLDPKPNCSELMKEALGYHEYCYRGGGDVIPSICHLNCKDVSAAFSVMKGSDLRDLWRAIKASLGVFGTCVISGFHEGFQGCFVEKAMEIAMKLIRMIAKKKIRRMLRSTECDDTCLGDGITASIFNQLNLPSEHTIEWFAFPETSEDNFVIEILFSDFGNLNGSTNVSTTSPPTYSLANIVDQFVGIAAEQKDFTINGETFEISQVSACNNVECTDTEDVYVAPPGAAITLWSSVMLIWGVQAFQIARYFF